MSVYRTIGPLVVLTTRQLESLERHIFYQKNHVILNNGLSKKKNVKAAVKNF